METLQNLPPIVALVLGLVLLAWLVLVFLVPFMIESIRQSARKTHEELVDMNEKLDRLHAALMQNRYVDADPLSGRPGRSEARMPAERPPAPGRREPTISDTDLKQVRRPDRREPIVR